MPASGRDLQFAHGKSSHLAAPPPVDDERPVPGVQRTPATREVQRQLSAAADVRCRRPK